VYTALPDTEVRHTIVSDTAPVMIWRSGFDGHCDFFNPTWLIFTGRSVAQELGDGWIQGVHADDLDRYMVKYCAAFNARMPFQLEHRLRQFDGEYRWVRNTGIPRWDKDGTFAGYTGSCIEITDRMYAERSCEDTPAELGRVSRFTALGAFASLIAHEVRQRLRRHRSQSQST
jgi:PAS domain S-box-containing protein